ncbi:cel3, partial [Symbiodinium pilosum]
MSRKLVWFSLAAAGMIGLLSLVIAGLVGAFAEAEEPTLPGSAVIRRLEEQANPFTGKQFYVNPSY